VRSDSPFLVVGLWSAGLLSALGAGGGALGGCDGSVVDLGAPRPPPYRFGTPRLVAELDTTFANQNPTLTGDLLDLYFTSNRGDTGADVWLAHRAAPTGPFDPPARVAEVSTELYETSPAISLDGLSLYFGSDRPGGAGAVDIWSATRPGRASSWSGIENLVTANSAANDIPRPPGAHGLVMPMSSERDTPDGYQTYLAVRSSVAQPFGSPAIVSELTFADTSLTDAFLSDDGLTLIYARAPFGGSADLFVAWRASPTEQFRLATPLELNTATDERDPWLSPDGTLFYFSSNRSGELQIYEATVTRQPR
jgi:hypothetical protein